MENSQPATPSPARTNTPHDEDPSFSGTGRGDWKRAHGLRLQARPVPRTADPDRPAGDKDQDRVRHGQNEATKCTQEPHPHSTMRVQVLRGPTGSADLRSAPSCLNFPGHTMAFALRICRVHPQRSWGASWAPKLHSGPIRLLQLSVSYRMRAPRHIIPSVTVKPDKRISKVAHHAAPPHAALIEPTSTHLTSFYLLPPPVALGDPDCMLHSALRGSRRRDGRGRRGQGGG